MTFPEPREFVNFPDEMQPQLVVVGDVEEEFDWSKPFSRDETSVTNVDELWRAQDIFDRHNVVPTYVIDYPVATTDSSVNVLRAFYQDHRCEIGAQLHPWVNPPFEEEVCVFNSFPGNLPQALEFEKLRILTEKIEQNFGTRPTTYRAGRYGFSAHTSDTLEKLGYEIDVSVVPYTSFASEGGPDYTNHGPQPFWFGRHRKLLEAPATCGFSGRLSNRGKQVFPLIGSAFSENLKIRSAAAHLNILDRVRLSPEGMTLKEMIRVTEQLLADGTKYFQLSFHSSALSLGSTEYVSNDQERIEFLNRIDDYLTWAKYRGIGTVNLKTALPIVTGFETQLRDEEPITQIMTSNPALIPATFEPEPMNYQRRRLIGKLSNRHKSGPKRDIFIFSSPRGGSTYLMELIGTDTKIKMLDEPLNPRKPTIWRHLNVRSWEDATLLENREAVYMSYFERLKNNQIPELNAPFYGPNHRQNTNRIVYKIIHGGEDMVDWFEQELGGQIVILLRHPIPTALSHRRNPRLPHLLSVNGIRRHLNVHQLSFASNILESGSYFDKSILDWGLQNFLLAGLGTPKSWLHVSYEHLVVSPQRVLDKLFHALDLDPIENLSEALLSPSGSSIQSDPDTREFFQSPDQKNRSFLVNKWLDRVDEKIINQTQEMLDVFGIDCYAAHEPLPTNWRFGDIGVENG
jgi:hypothetical protein